ncbi:hypothetical protein CMQ_8077 [Grosmannia clavigera kw1407]|uniref:Uncharacterized protein n=1 Tax=Grosmannia clavigera (strain kw1407 / UAMH 11150) TaxID=655863 RepID=F0XKZ7_GROCL|nr:uncharacterized protein CMQ_8077 [Grosmannia clavigera kw1407]EFX01611.1 hypothetical protein CMQ_8077 [Grosmannia clavigera kw1407]
MAVYFVRRSIYTYTVVQRAALVWPCGRRSSCRVATGILPVPFAISAALDGGCTHLRRSRISGLSAPAIPLAEPPISVTEPLAAAPLSP